MALAAYGVDHKELISIAEPLLSDLPSVPRPQEPKSVYTGGDYRCYGDSGVCIRYVVYVHPGYLCPLVILMTAIFTRLTRERISLLHLSFLVAGIRRRKLWL